METINDVVNFLTQMELFKIENGLHCKTFNIIGKILIDEFEDIDSDELYEMLRTLDDLCIEYLRMKVYFDKTLLTTLRDKIFVMYEENMIKKPDNAYYLILYNNSPYFHV